MEDTIEEAMKLLSPEEQVRARNTLHELTRCGFFKAILLAWDKRAVELLPTRVLEPDAQKTLMNELAERGIVLRFLAVMERKGVPHGERILTAGSTGIRT